MGILHALVAHVIVDDWFLWQGLGKVISILLLGVNFVNDNVSILNCFPKVVEGSAEPVGQDGQAASVSQSEAGIVVFKYSAVHDWWGSR
jgi:hypothetical protein